MITNYSNEYCFSCLLSLLVILFRPLNASFIGQWTAKCTYSVPRIINGYMSFCICSINNKSITVLMQTDIFSENKSRPSRYLPEQNKEHLVLSIKYVNNFIISRPQPLSAIYGYVLQFVTESYFWFMFNNTDYWQPNTKSLILCGQNSNPK